jgi:murein DD-endopeptidase MepM/ murein hydrolase activator NlpD
MYLHLKSVIKKVPRKPLYHFNPETLSFERVTKSLLQKLKWLIFHTLTGISMGLIFFVLYLQFFDTPLTKKLREENAQLKTQYKVLQRRSKDMKTVLFDLRQRDNNLYRAILEAEPLPDSIYDETLSNTSRYTDLSGMKDADLMIYTSQQIDKLAKMTYIQSKSYDELLNLVKNKEVRLLSIPAIQPIKNKDLRSTASGFGPRIDPVYRVPRFHSGMDFTARTGTPVYATGEGVISFAGWKQGYGNLIEINHGYNYKTWYAHLRDMKVRNGQKVVRGEIIGSVGTTGKSTGSHLHYEVHYKGEAVNPTNYYFMDLSPEEYDKMIQISSNFGQTLD